MKQQVKISKVKGNPDNPRIIKNDKFKKLVKSIQEFPEMLKLRPIVVDEEMIVLGGNMRLKASKDAGLKEVWIEVAEGLTEEQKKEFIVKDNVGFGEWEWDILANEWDSVQLAEWGLDVWENEDDKIAEAGLIEDDEIPEVKESKVKRGDIWQLGEHRIMCGDSTSSDDVAKLMNGEKAELLLTDPPYGIDYGNQLIKGEEYKDKTNKHGWRNFGNPEWDKSKPENGALQYLCSITDNQIIWGGNYFTDDLPPSMGWLIWDKGQRGFSLADGEMAWTSFNNALRIKEYARAKANKEDKKHPTQKPIEIITWCLEYADRHSKENPKIILDTYLGSGTTLIVAQKLKRKCYGMELDEKYCDVIIERWEQFTGQKAIKNGTE